MKNTSAHSRERFNFFDLASRTILVIFFVRSLLILCVPLPVHRERLWLEWLGMQIISHASIPHALGYEALSSAGAPWIAQSWLFAVFLAWCATHGLDLVPIVVTAIMVTLIPFITYIRLKRSGADAPTVTAAILILSATLQSTVQMRASMISYAACTATFAVLSCRDRRLYAIPVVVLFLVNVHATAVFSLSCRLLHFLQHYATRVNSTKIRYVY